MRFDSETRAKIQQAAPNPVTITWPKGERQPIAGRTYLVQSLEEKEKHAERERNRREHHPETHREVMAGMYARRYNEEMPNAPKPKPLSRKRAGCERIYVIATDVLGETEFEAKVVLYEDPDPVLHLHLDHKPQVPASAPRFDDEHPGPSTAIEYEPEQRPVIRSRREREEEETALRQEHKASVDRAKVIEYEQKLNERRKQGKPAPLQEAAIARAKRRAIDQSAA